MAEHDDEVRHRSLDGKDGVFFIQKGEQRIAELTYTLAGDKAIVDHTYVAPEHRGGVLAMRLVEALADWSRKERHPVIPMCSYVRSVFDRHPEKYGDIRAGTA